MKKLLILKGWVLFSLAFLTINPAILYAQNSLKEIIKEYYETGELKSEFDPNQEINKIYAKNGVLLEITSPTLMKTLEYYPDGKTLEHTQISTITNVKARYHREEIYYYENGKIRHKIEYGAGGKRILNDEYDETGKLKTFKKYRLQLFLYILLLLLFFSHLIKSLVAVICSKDENIKISYRSVFVSFSIIIQFLLFNMVCSFIIDDETSGSWSRITSAVITFMPLLFLSIVNMILSLYMCKIKNLRPQALLYLGISGIIINPVVTMGMAELVCEYLGY